MKKIFLFFYFGIIQLVYSQVPITDTVKVNTYNDAQNLTFGLLPKEHYPSGYLLNKAGAIPKTPFANGLLSDSSFNMLEFYFIQNSIRMSYNNPDSIKGFLYLDSLKNKYIEQNNVLPFGIIDISGHLIRDSAFLDGSMIVSSHRIVENTTDLNKLYTKAKRFCVAPLNIEVNTLNPQFIIKPEFIFSNNSISINSIQVDLDDGLGFKPVSLNTNFQAVYTSGGFKQFLTCVIYSNGDTLYSRSELNVIDNNIARLLSSTYQPYDENYEIKTIDLNQYNYPNEFTPNLETDRYAEIGVWYGCGNTAKKIRKPFIIFAGYNPKDGKSLVANSNAAWINDSFGAALALDGWRGPLYETYNGFYTDASKDAAGGNSFGDNGNNILDKIRKEGYDVMIVRFYDGIGYLQTSAFIASVVLNNINDKILSEIDNVTNPGADLDPEYPPAIYGDVIKKAKHELIVAGFSAGALASRMALTLMEYQNEKYACESFDGTSKRNLKDNHRTKTWIAIDHEAQGSNTSIGQQMFMDFEKSVWYLPANTSDIYNSLICQFALDLIKKNGVATQNTLYHIDNMNYIGSSNWNMGHHPDFDTYFSDLVNITPTSHPDNLKGYPKNPYRIAVSQGNANGIPQILSPTDNLIYNQSPSAWCASPAGTQYGISPPPGFLTISPYREAKGRPISALNNEAFYCQLGTSFRTFFYNWFVSFGHPKYHDHNYIADQYFGTRQPYDVTSASTLPAHIILGRKLSGSPNPYTAAFADCNLEQWNENQVGFSPTVSGLDLHLPGNNTLPRLPNLSLIPGNVIVGLNLMYQNKRASAPFDNPSPHEDFGYPHLTFPTNHYDYTPYDAIWANTRLDKYYYDNTIHVEDPNPYSGEFLVEEIAPQTLYLSNRTISGEKHECDGYYDYKKYYADFEARNSILAGNQNIYEHESPRYKRVRTSPGDFIVDTNAVVTMRANNGDGQSSIVLGAGFSAKAGSIFRAYIYTDPNMCNPFSSSQRLANSNLPDANIKQARPIYTKRANTQKLQQETKTISIALYPNPTNGNLYYVINNNEEFNYTITDITGKIIQTGQIGNVVNTINLSNFDKGIYLLTVSNKSYTQTDRIILQ